MEQGRKAAAVAAALAAAKRKGASISLTPESESRIRSLLKVLPNVN